MCQFAGKTFGEELKKMWLTCAIESEGSLQLAWGKRPAYAQIIPRLNLCNQSSEYIERAINFSQELGLDGHVNKHSDRETIYIIWQGFKRVKKLLETIFPYMCIERKKEIAEIMLDFINFRLSVPVNQKYGLYEKELFMKVRELNGKGDINKQFLKFSFEKFPRESSETIRPTLKSEDIVRSA